MKKRTFIRLIFLYCITGLLFSFTFEELNGQTSDDTLKITATSLDYIEGWYEGNALRLKQSLHKKLAKRQVLKNPVTGKTRITRMNDWQLTMIINIIGGGSRIPKNERNISVQILDISGNIASVKVGSRDFTDFLQLARRNNEWTIVNILWEPKPVEPGEGKSTPGLIIFLILFLILSPFALWPVRYFIQQYLNKKDTGIHRYCADRRLISRINLLLTILFICLFFIYGGWIIYIICMLSIPNIVWSNWINWKQKFWSVPGRIYYSILSFFILLFDFIILLQLHIL